MRNPAAIATHTHGTPDAKPAAAMHNYLRRFGPVAPIYANAETLKHGRLKFICLAIVKSLYPCRMQSDGKVPSHGLLQCKQCLQVRAGVSW